MAKKRKIKRIKLTAVKRQIGRFKRKRKKIFKRVKRQCQKMAKNKAKILLIGCLFIIAGGLFLWLKNISYFQPASAAGIDVWWDANWPNRKKLTFNNSGQAESLVNFPVLVHLTSSKFNFDRAQEHGEDIRFTDSNGALLTYEIEKWDKAGKEAWIWVKVPQIDGSSNTDYIWMYYGNFKIVGDIINIPSNTWDANYKGVWHTEGSGLYLSDSTNNLNRATLTNTSGWTTSGQIAGAYNFNNTDDYASVAETDSSTLEFDAAPGLTLEAWINESGSGGNYGDIRGLTSTLQFASGLDADIIPVAGSKDKIYAIAYAATLPPHNALGVIKTVEIDYSGRIVRVIQTWTFEPEWASYPDIIHISGDVYAITYAYNDTGAGGKLQTLKINSAGVISATPTSNSLMWGNGTPFHQSPIIHVTGIIYAIVSDFTSRQITTVKINNDGTIPQTGNPIAWKNDILGAGKEINRPNFVSLGSSGSNYYFAAVSEVHGSATDDSDDFGLLTTFKITSAGAISASSTDVNKWQYRWDWPVHYAGWFVNIIKINGSSNDTSANYAVVYRGKSSDGQYSQGTMKTFTINNDGTIIKPFTSSMYFNNPQEGVGVTPQMINVIDTTYALIYPYGGQLKILRIDPNPSSTKIPTVFRQFQYDTGDTRAPRIIPTTGHGYAIVHSNYSDLWLKPLEIITNKGVFKSDSYGVTTHDWTSTKSSNYDFINNVLRLSTSVSSGWNYLVLTYDKSQIKLYANGGLKTSRPETGNVINNYNDFTIGQFLKGKVDEVRISSTARSANWLAAQYLSMTDQFITFSDELWRRGDYWAWTDTFGWFNLDCPSELCGSATYRLTLPDDPPLGEPEPITGWIWSENAGWVCFGSSCCGVVGVECKAPDLSDAAATYTKTDYSSEIKGWAKVWALGDDGWLKLRCDYEDDEGCEVDPAQFSNFPFCYDCYLDQGASKCRICYTSSDYDGSGNICSGCIRCGGGGEPNTCGECSSCYQYGLACRQNISGLGCLTGWAWNGNWDCSVLPCSDTGQPGLGWFTFNFGSSIIVPPWLQTQWGDVYSGGEIKGLAGTPPGTLPNKQYNATYLIHANGTVENFESWWCQEHPADEQNCGKLPFGTLTFPKKETNYFGTLGRIDLAGIKEGYYGSVVECDCNNSLCVNSLPTVLEGKVYHFIGDCEVNSPINISSNQLQKGNGLVLVEGNLIIKANVNYSDSTINKLRNLASIGWLVIDDGSGTKGNVVIDPGVTELVGAFYGENKIWSSATYSGGVISGVSSPTLLDVTGLMVSKNFAFNRTVGSYLRGAEVVIDDGRAIANTPPGMEDLVKGLPIWSATAP